MPTIDEYAHRPREERLTRIARTPSELAAAVRGAGNEVLARRPAPKSWAATEVICHLRDNEEWFLDSGGSGPTTGHAPAFTPIRAGGARSTSSSR